MKKGVHRWLVFTLIEIIVIFSLMGNSVTTLLFAGIIAQIFYIPINLLIGAVRRMIDEDKKIADEITLDSAEKNQFSKMFISTNEKYVSSLGNGYLASYLAKGNLGKGFAVISDKRVYFKGSCFTRKDKMLIKSNEERTVDIKDITGSGFIHMKSFGALLGIISVLFATIVSLYFVLESASGEDQKYTRSKRAYKSYQEFIDYYEKDNDAFSQALINIYNSTPSELSRYEEKLTSVLKNNFGLYSEEDWNNFIRAKSNPENVMERAKTSLEKEKEKINRYRGYLIGYAFIVGGILSLSLSILLTLFEHITKQKTYFEVQYAGGRIAFEVSYYVPAEIEDFQKQLRMAKDLYEETSVKAKAITDIHKAEQDEEKTSAVTNISDELRKYAKLLEDGLISQEEYDAMRKKVLGL